MKTFNEETILAVKDHLKKVYSIELQKQCDGYTYCTDRTDFVITPYYLHMAGLACPDMVGDYRLEEFDTIDEVIFCIDNELKYYLPTPNTKVVCKVCGSDKVREERLVTFEINDPDNTIQNSFSGFYCDICEDETEVKEQ